MIFKSVFCNDVVRILRSRGYYIVMALLVTFTLIVFTVSIVNRNEKSNEYTIYGVSEYETFEQLNDNLTRTLENLQNQIDSLEYESSINALTKAQIEFRNQQIKDSELRINVMSFLYNNKIPFNHASQYNSLKNKCGVSILNHCYVIASIIIGLITLVRLSLAIPNEIKEGQARLTLTLPITRTRYSLYRLILISLQSLILFLAYAAFALLISYMFYPSSDTLIFANNSRVFGVGAVMSTLIQFAFASVAIIGFGIFTFAISLLTLNKIVTLFISIPICFGGKVIQILESMFSQNNVFSRIFISSNFFIQQSYSNASSNNVVLSAVVLLSYLSIIAILALMKFKHQDIVN